MQANGKSKNGDEKLKRKVYENELRKLQVKLCRLQDWIKIQGIAGGHHIRGPRRRR